ncbi:hypothetical protein AWN90_05850 [Nocardia terpenica]|uniref:Secreted protein n=1 Tax=Nocardia terpenica TaxID=455432 RepID=A0A164J6J5_9NOCA|nr:hypothetical protein AWN90_05850 [Nocardia terpenica]
MFAVLVALAAIGTFQAGSAAADSASLSGASHGGGSAHTGNSGMHDTTGAHRGDPMGFNHTDRNPVLQNQHQDATRNYHAERNRQLAEGSNVSVREGGAERYTCTVRDPNC